MVDVATVQSKILKGSTGVVNQQGNTTPQIIDTFFNETDTNKDGRLSSKELEARVAVRWLPGGPEHDTGSRIEHRSGLQHHSG